MNFSLKHIAIICCLCATAARSQEWIAVGGGADRPIRGMYTDTANHLLYAVGQFQSIGGVVADGVAVWDGQQWTSLCQPSIPPDNAAIISALVYDGELIVSGQQHRMEDQNCRILAKHNGTSWEPFGDPNIFGQLHLVEDELFFTGYFTEIDGQNIQKIARWNGNQWEAFGDPSIWDNFSDASVDKIVKYKDNYIAAGNFELPEYKEILQWNGNEWLPLQNGLLGDAGIGSMVVYKDILYVGGFFSKMSGNPKSNVMAWDGEKWFDPLPGVEFIFQATDIQIIDNELYIVALFKLEGDDKIYTFCKFDGDNFCAFGEGMYQPNLTDPQRITGMDGKIYVSCNKVLYSDTVNYIAQWNGTEMDTCVYMPMHAGISEIENAKNLLSAYPNPGSESVTVSWQAASGNKAQLIVTDQLSKTINSIAFNTTPGENKYILDLTALANGIYFVRITDGTEIQTCKIIKK